MSNAKKLQVAIIGVSGYTGGELLRLLNQHNCVEFKYLAGKDSANSNIKVFYPDFPYDIDIVPINDVDYSAVDLVFCCLPHTQSQIIVSKIEGKVPVIDLSADFRLPVALYEKWYGEHLAPSLQEKAIYGLTEYVKKDLPGAKIVACPGCYPTSVLFPILPLVKHNIIDLDNIVINAQSGISGAGRDLIEGNLFCNVNENGFAYKIGVHRHLPEIELMIKKFTGASVEVEFISHIVPMTRGMLSTIVLQLQPEFSFEMANDLLQDTYKDELFVHVVDQPPSVKNVVGGNNIKLSCSKGRKQNSIVIVSAIDNLLKGASGQAVQNMNLMFGFKEDEGLINCGYYV